MYRAAPEKNLGGEKTMKRNFRTILALAALILTLGASYALASKACCVEPEVNNCCATSATSECCR